MDNNPAMKLPGTLLYHNQPRKYSRIMLRSSPSSINTFAPKSPGPKQSTRNKPTDTDSPPPHTTSAMKYGSSVDTSRLPGLQPSSTLNDWGNLESSRKYQATHISLSF